MIVNGVTVTAALAGLTLAIVLSAWLVRGTSATETRQEAMREGSHPAGKRHVTEEWHAVVVDVPPSSSTPAGLALTWHHLADMAMRSAFAWHQQGNRAAAYDAWQRAQAHRATARRWEYEAQTTGQAVDTYL